MSYVKLHKVVSDFAVGYQSVNQALENNRALFSAIDLKHSLGVGGTSTGDAFLGHGKHDDTVIARTVADFTIDTSLTVPRAYALTTGPLVFDVPEYLEAGKWLIYITTPRLIGAVAQIRDTATSDLHATVRAYMAAGGPFVVVSTWNIVGGTRANHDFSLVLWSDGLV